MSKVKILSEITGIPEYRITADDQGEFIPKSCALQAMDLHAENTALNFNEWIQKNAYRVTPNGMYYHKDDLYKETPYSPKELYVKFKG